MANPARGASGRKKRRAGAQKGPLCLQLYHKLKRDIITCRIRPGVSLTDTWLCERFGASRTVVRDACLRLAKEDLLGWVPNKGYHVTAISLQDLNELFELREVLETAAAELACARRIPAALDEAEELGAATYQAGEKGSFPAFLERNHAFHVLLARMSGNRRLFDQLDHVLAHFARFSYLTMAADSYGGDVVREHRAILDAIRRGDAEAARRTTREHMKLSKQRAVRYFLGE